MNEAPTGNAADRRILIKSSPVRCWREEPILIPSYVPAASVSRSVLRPQPLCRYRRRHRSCRGPYRARSRSDKHAAVLRLQRTQPKDRRAYDAPYRIPCMAGAGGGKLRDADRGSRQRPGTSTRRAQRLARSLSNSVK